MIKIENVDVYGFETAIRGMRNPLNSWDKSDSFEFPPDDDGAPWIGKADMKLMRNLCRAGSDHRKFLRMINVTMDIVAPLYWWKEYDTYKVGTVANSCSTMHKIADKEFTLDDFSCEHLITPAKEHIESTIEALNAYRNMYLNFEREGSAVKNVFDNDNKNVWWQMIQLLPSSYNQRRTVQLNYEALLNMYYARKDHKLDEWRAFCKVIETLPYFKKICLGGEPNAE